MRFTWKTAVAAILGLTSPWTLAATSTNAPTLTVFAAASLTDVMQEIGAEYTKANRIAVKYSFAASSALARQIESGAAVDIFMSADQEWMNYLDSRLLIDRSTRRDIVSNRLALVAPVDSAIHLTIEPGFSLRAALGRDGRLATGDPDSVPAGKYAKAALMSLGVWHDVEPRLVRAENVRAALAFVARGEVPLGIVYQTDARADPKVKLVAMFPESSHTPITYPVAATPTAKASAAGFIAFLGSPPAGAIFERAGFRPLNDRRQ